METLANEMETTMDRQELITNEMRVIRGDVVQNIGKKQSPFGKDEEKENYMMNTLDSKGRAWVGSFSNVSGRLIFSDPIKPQLTNQPYANVRTGIWNAFYVFNDGCCRL